MQDTPANKITYSAQIFVKKGFVVKMSANDTSFLEYNDTHNEYRFECSI